MRHLVFVSTDLFPWSTGAAGRLLSNLLRSLSESDRARSVVMMVDTHIEPASFDAAFPGVRMLQLDTETAEPDVSTPQSPPARAYVNAVGQWRSAQIYRALAVFARTANIEYVEFPARDGLAFCTLQERRLKGFLADALVAVRLQDSHTALMQAEARPIAMADLNLSDLERKSLRDCDVVVASSVALTDVTRAAFGFSDDGWSCRLVNHLPMLHCDFTPRKEQAIPASFEQPIVFTSAVRRAERPDLVVRAVAGFMSEELCYVGRLMLVGEHSDAAYASQLQRMAPPVLSPRMHMDTGLARAPWEALISSACVVFPGVSASCCLAAWEASILGARLILNASNPGFGVDSPWIDGLNCLKFDGTASGLVGTLKRNVARNESLQVVQYPETPWPWLAVVPRPSKWRPVASRPMVSVVVSHYNLGAYLPETLRNLSEQRYPEIEVVVIDDASTDGSSIRLVASLVSESNPRLKIIRSATNMGLAAARNMGVRHATGKYVLTLDADDLIHPDFLTVGVAALENNADFDIVVTQAGYFQDGEIVSFESGRINFSDYAVFTGEAVVAGLLENKFSTATALFRKTALDRFPYEESLACYEDWSLYMRMCDAGLRFIVTTDIFFYYRRRTGSMVHASRDTKQMEIEYNDMLRTSVATPLRECARYLVIGHASPAAGHTIPDGYAVLRRKWATGGFGPRGQYDDQVAFASFKVSRWLERHVPWLIRGGVGLAQWVWRMAKRRGGQP